MRSFRARCNGVTTSFTCWMFPHCIISFLIRGAARGTFTPGCCSYFLCDLFSVRIWTGGIWPTPPFNECPARPTSHCIVLVRLYPPAAPSIFDHPSFATEGTDGLQVTRQQQFIIVQAVVVVVGFCGVLSLVYFPTTAGVDLFPILDINGVIHSTSSYICSKISGDTNFTSLIIQSFCLLRCNPSLVGICKPNSSEVLPSGSACPSGPT